MKKLFILVLSSFIICCIALSVILLNQNEDNKKAPPSNNPSDNNENKKYDVKITEFNFTSTWGPIAGVTLSRGFNITLQNLKNEDSNGLSLEIKMFDINGNQLQIETLLFGPGILGHTAQVEPFDGILLAKENRTIRGGTLSDLHTINTAYLLGPITTVASIKIGNETLDEWKSTA